MKSFLPIKSRTFGLLFLFALGAQMAFGQKPKTAPVDMVYPLLDAANSRWFFFNSATRPFGMVNLSPDNAYAGDWGSGYRIYFAKESHSTLVLFGGGTKRSQKRDINTVLALYAEYKVRKKLKR